MKACSMNYKNYLNYKISCREYSACGIGCVFFPFKGFFIDGYRIRFAILSPSCKVCLCTTQVTTWSSSLQEDEGKSSKKEAKLIRWVRLSEVHKKGKEMAWDMWHMTNIAYYTIDKINVHCVKQKIYIIVYKTHEKFPFS